MRQATEPTSLAQTQSWLQQALFNPAGDENALRQDAEEKVTPSATLSARQRLAVYQHSYWGRLLACMGELFPGVCHALGAAVFEGFATEYLTHFPSHSYSLDHLGTRFVTYLQHFRPDAQLPPDQREGWPDFLEDLAALELAVSQIYDGPGIEDQPPPTEAQQVAMLQGALPFKPAPCLRLMRFRYPVHVYLKAVKRGKHPAAPQPESTHIAVTRCAFQVRFFEHHPWEHGFLEALVSGSDLSQALAQNSLAPVLHAQNPAQGWLTQALRRAYFFGGDMA
ncbi:HvfC/BufC N-terminal domain-containing protein [Acanthopleuribacter pedis]|uniref:Putative DNA-binding domain-containing protein n=1 Tax=Acanthopleuribacter pedis TaxID=442870 RepID=A0A8J7QKU7_9BACT|nr:DNA-binding domain-containing protein [Acanthopleuribacter pedis]MBO1322916.1 putative DNA-binding domain-containing protein [Acanthopleuribacter pedis]